MLPLDYPFFIAEAGRFGAARKFDNHTGIDLYAPEGSPVYAIEAGHCIDAGAFTGQAVGSPWWHETSYAVVSGKNIFLYGEIRPAVSVGERVKEGQVIGYIQTVLKKDKGLPMAMLHLEKYSFYDGPVEWPLDTARPAGLEDPPTL